MKLTSKHSSRIRTDWGSGLHGRITLSPRYTPDTFTPNALPPRREWTRDLEGTWDQWYPTPREQTDASRQIPLKTLPSLATGKYRTKFSKNTQIFLKNYKDRYCLFVVNGNQSFRNSNCLIKPESNTTVSWRPFMRNLSHRDVCGNNCIH